MFLRQICFSVKMLSVFPDCSDGEESTCNAGDPGSIPGLGRSPGEGNGYRLHSSTLAWRIQWIEEPGRLQSVVSQRVGHKWAANTFTFKRLSVVKSSVVLKVINHLKISNTKSEKKWKFPINLLWNIRKCFIGHSLTFPSHFIMHSKTPIVERWQGIVVKCMDSGGVQWLRLHAPNTKDTGWIC